MKIIQVKGSSGAIVDDDDFENLNKWTWRLNERGYVVSRRYRNGKYHNDRLHRIIANAPPHLQVDHINRNKLDNRKMNLRLCNNSQNNRNRHTSKPGESPYKGVSRNGKKWMSKIRTDFGRVYLGVYDTQEKAAEAYDRAAVLYHGEFAYLNNAKQGGKYES